MSGERKSQGGGNSLASVTEALGSGEFGTLRWDEFQQVEVLETDECWKVLDPAEMTLLQVSVEHRTGASFGPGIFKRAVHALAKANPFDSAQQWLAGLPTWDGVSRVDEFLMIYLGTTDTSYHRAVGRYLWTALAARVAFPGSKADMVPVLVGKQGAGKTSVIKLIPPDLELFHDVCLTDRSAALGESVLGKLVLGWEELRGIRGRVDADQVKTFITGTHFQVARSDRRGTELLPRRFVIVGTANRRDFLKDPTGHRRYLPFDVGVIDLERTERDVLMLWAEALSMIKTREASGLPAVDFRDAEALAAAEYEKYIDQGIWVDDPLLINWLGSGADKFKTGDALRIVNADPMDLRNLAQMKKSLQQLGFEARSTHLPGMTSKPKRWRVPSSGFKGATSSHP